MPLPIIAAIAGGLTAGATFAASDCRYHQLDLINYLLSATIIVFSIGMIYLGRQGTLTVRTCLIGWGVMGAIFTVLAVRLKRAADSGHQATFVKAVSLVSYAVSGVALFVTLLLWWAQVRSGTDPLDTMVQLQARIDAIVLANNARSE